MMKMKKVFVLLLVVSLLSAAVFSVSAQTTPTNEDAPSQQQSSQTVWDVLQSRDDLSDFATWIEAAGLSDNLDNDGPFTVFAPTNAAMTNFRGTAADSAATRTQILLYHVVNGRYPAASMNTYDTRPTLLGDPVTINGADGQISLNDDVQITTADIQASNGVIHIIDTVLIPPTNSLNTATRGSQTNTLDEVLAADGRFTTFLALLQQAGMQDQLANASQNYTVFAPTDAAFAKLSDNQTNDLLGNQDDLQTILSYHIVNDRLGINQIATDHYIPTAEGRPLIVTHGDNGAVFLNGYPVTDFNMVASNGVIHVVDTVLTP
ncbi:MAG: fasciclin domain-containing protein [Ardenticatenaceae bacterium]|nr:fasciclin domain-containing protein [Ardenticatenaceae bacterium]MCB8987585.1 fasciclin domain-containing protein [Ardenticatenaceae bacterium]